MLNYECIIKEEDKNLREKSLDVLLPLCEEDLQTMYDLYEYLQNGYDSELAEKLNIRPGVGIAAPQIGVLKKMFVIIAFDEHNEYHEYGVINPKILSHSEELAYIDTGEGCLSVDRPVNGLVHRYRRIKVKFDALDFETGIVEKITLKLRGYISIVFQHEYDHLFGRLFVDRINTEDPFFIPENSTAVVFDEEENTDDKTDA